MKPTARATPKDWVWVYHGTPEKNLNSIVKHGLKPTPHEAVDGAPVIFVEPEIEGIEPYYFDGMAILRFKTPGFASTDDGESVLFAGSERGDIPDEPFVRGAGEDGVIPPERIQILVGRKFEWIIP